MAIATTRNIDSTTVFGNLRVVIGRSVLSGTTNLGEVVTGLRKVMLFIPIVAAATQQGVSVDETLPLAGGTVSVVVETNDSTFDWIAIGL